MWEHSVLPAAIHQLVILVTAAKFGARYEIYGHEYFAGRAGLAEQKIASIVAGERPSDLTDDERVAYDMAAALNRGGPLPETTYRAVLTTFGEAALAEDRLPGRMLLDGRCHAQRVRCFGTRT